MRHTWMALIGGLLCGYALLPGCELDISSHDSSTQIVGPGSVGDGTATGGDGLTFDCVVQADQSTCVLQGLGGSAEVHVVCPGVDVTETHQDGDVLDPIPAGGPHTCEISSGGQTVTKSFQS